MARPLKLLAVASAGGHWNQLMRLRPAFDDGTAVFVSTMPQEVGDRRFHLVRDASRWDKLAMLRLLLQVVRIVLAERPDVVISTGAAPGYLMLRLGKLVGARTIWVDSFANVNELSMSGRLAERYSDLWLTQWAHLAKPEGPRFSGTVL